MLGKNFYLILSICGSLTLFIVHAQDLFIEKLTFESDVPFSQEEFLYLTDLKSKTFITLQDIEIAKKQLMYKKRFNKIEAEINEDTKHLHFILTSNWLFKRLALQGIWFEKHQYTSLYQQQPGDVFDISLHEESLKAIKSHLHEKGYFNCSIKDELFYKKFDKSIIVRIEIKKHRCFTINQVTFQLACNSQENTKNLDDQFWLFKEKLERKIGTKLLNKNYSKNLIEKEVKIIRNFFKKRGFIDSHIAVKRIINKKNHLVSLIFKIKLGQKRELLFKGNRRFSDKQIREELIGLDYPSWFFSPEIIAEQILNKYQQKGYFNAIIHYKKMGHNRFLFNIQENHPITIDKIIVKDETNNVIPSQDLFFNELLKNKIFDAQIFQKGIDQLKDFYLKNGFWEFEVIDKKFIKKEKGKITSIILNIKKGIQRFWGDYKIEGFEKLEKKDFFVKYTAEKHMPFNLSWLQEQKSFLLRYFQKKGYWYVNAALELNFKPFKEKNNGILVFVNWKINPGPKIKFGKVIVKGNTRLPFCLIQKEIKFNEGDLWDKKKIDQTRKNLKRLDIFKHVQLQPHKVSKDKNDLKQPVILTLIDDDPLQTRLRLGYFLTSKNFLFKRASTYKLGTSLVVKNPTNQADKLQLNADFTRFERKLDVDYQIPSPFGFQLKTSSLIGKCKLYANKYIHPVEILQSGSAYEAEQTGFWTGISNEYQNGYFWGTNIGNEWIKTTKVRGNLKLADELINVTTPFLFIEPTLIVDKLDDRLDVKNGTLTFLALKFMIPERSSDPFTKLTFEQSYFHPVFKKLIFGARIRFGHIFRQDFNQIQPIERFYLGGPYSVRGYEKDALPPLGISEETKPDGTVIKKYTIQGGSSMVNGNLELRFPIYKSLRGIVFQDIGVLSQVGFSGCKGKWYPATGFGFRYKTPIGPLRFDIGWKWKHRLPGDSAYAWYLTLGEAF